MSAEQSEEHDNAGLAYAGAPRRRGLLAALGLRRSPAIAPQGPGFPPIPLAPYNVQVGPQVGPLMPLASPNVQLGVYAKPYGAPTQTPAYNPGLQKFCGVEAIDRHYVTQGSPASPAPYYQQTMRPSFPVMTTRDGGRPGATVGPAGAALAFGAIRDARLAEVQGLAAGLLGW